MHKPLPVFKKIKRKMNSAGLRILGKLEKLFYELPQNFCLITGAPRSGTTAMERWLNEQNNVTVFHESRLLITLHRFLEETKRHSKLDPHVEFTSYGRNIAFKFYNKRKIIRGQNLIIDKEPLEPIGFPDKNYASFLQNYRTLFPHGKLFFMLRDPLSTIWSMKKRKWGYSLRDYKPRSFSIESHIETWCECADLILEYADDEYTYVCYFERLVNNPEIESEKIFNFLQISDGKPFQPREVKTVDFGDDERDLIRKKTKSRLEALTKKRLID